jgi:hypothetical protein
LPGYFAELRFNTDAFLEAGKKLGRVSYKALEILLAPPLRRSVLTTKEHQEVAMNATMNPAAPPLNIEQPDHENNDRPENQIVTACVMAADRQTPGRINWPGSLPASSFTVMVVVDCNGHFQPLYTAGDLLRWCKSTWAMEQD